MKVEEAEARTTVALERFKKAEVEMATAMEVKLCALEQLIERQRGDKEALERQLANEREALRQAQIH